MRELSNVDCIYISGGQQSNFQNSIENTLVGGALTVGAVIGFCQAEPNPVSQVASTIIYGFCFGVGGKIVAWALIKTDNALVK